MSPASKARRKSNTEKSAQPKLIRMLIVDDHPIVRRGLVAMLSQEPDMKVVAEAENFHDALEAIKQHPLDVAIIDLTLEGIGGLELVKQVRITNPELHLLVLSMHDESLYAERVLRAGARGYIMKQEGTDRLITAIRTILRGEIYVSERMASRMLGSIVGGRSSDSRMPLDRLSDRELEVFELLGKGMGTRQVAERLCVSIKTIESHREHIKLKLQLKNASELIQHATQWVLSDSQSNSDTAAS